MENRNTFMCIEFHNAIVLRGPVLFANFLNFKIIFNSMPFVLVLQIIAEFHVVLNQIHSIFIENQ